MATPPHLNLGDIPLRRIGLGTNGLTNTPENVAFIRQAAEAGITMIDTAYVYTRGESEAAIGSALSPIPEGCVVATKGGFDSGRPDVLRQQTEESLRRLRTDRIGLYYLHRVDPETPLEESLATIEDFRRAGSVGHVGLSNVSVEQIERARAVTPIAAGQNHFNLSERQHDQVVDYCSQEGIVFVPYFPLRGEARPEVPEIAKRHGATPAQASLAWLLRRSAAMLPIPGSLSIDHVTENLAALELELTDAEFETLA